MNHIFPKYVYDILTALLFIFILVVAILAIIGAVHVVRGT